MSLLQQQHYRSTADPTMDIIHVKFLFSLELLMNSGRTGYKLIGELGTKLNNSLKKVRDAEKSRPNVTRSQSTAPVRSGASPRQNIAQTSRRQSDGQLIR